jgi:hypothetical protein
MVIWEEMVLMEVFHQSSYKELHQEQRLMQGTCFVHFAEVKWKGGGLWMLPGSISIARYGPVHRKLVDLVGLMRSCESMQGACTHQHVHLMWILQGNGTGDDWSGKGI